jgi:L,D-peptidoglycan transpeptidase YkuD (ErfK/YbiS/YcfS/YnhG family)
MLKSPVAATRTLAEYGEAIMSTVLTGYNGVMYMATDDPEYWEGNKKIVYQNRPDKGKLKMAKEWRDAIPIIYTVQRWSAYSKISDFYIK